MAFKYGCKQRIYSICVEVEWPIAISSIREHASSYADAILKLLAAYAVQRGAAVHEC